MTLNSQKFKPAYLRSMGDDPLNDFYIPALKNSIYYDRLSGFFSPASLTAAAEGMASFIKNGGKYRLIFSKYIFSDKDFDAINDSKLYKDFIDSSTLDIEELTSQLKDRPRQILGWMIENNYLEIKIAFTVPDDTMEHSKWGVFKDTEGNVISYNGSLNETYNGWAKQHEKTRVFCSWENEQFKVITKDESKLFETYWNNEAPNSKVISFPDVLKEQLVINSQITSKEKAIEESIALLKDKKVLKTEGKKLEPYEYQKEAIKAWKENNHNGIFALATGLGKTFTSIFSMNKYKKSVDNKCLTVVVVPSKDLLEQWKNEFKKFDISAKVLRESNDWNKTLEEIVSYINLDIIENEVILVTYNIYCTPKFIKHIENVEIDTMLICDEVHKSGSKEFKKGLLDLYNSRIGLSATPKRHFDEEGSQYILDYFGGIVYEKDLAWGIKNGQLCPYNYHIQEISLTPNEQQEYNLLTAEMMTHYRDDQIKQSTAFYAKAGERADIIKEAKNKIAAFEENLNELNSKLDGAFIFCNTETNNKNDDDSQFDQIADILTRHKVRYNPITSKRDMVTRKDSLKKFAEGHSDVVLAIDCLDEGIDVPSAKMAFILSSTTNEKQYIQRRGRVLRKSDNPDKVAEIYDYVCFPSNVDPSGKKMEKNLIKNQLRRAFEFADIAKNRQKNVDFIKLIAEKWEINIDG